MAYVAGLPQGTRIVREDPDQQGPPGVTREADADPDDAGDGTTAGSRRS